MSPCLHERGRTRPRNRNGGLKRELIPATTLVWPRVREVGEPGVLYLGCRVGTTCTTLILKSETVMDFTTVSMFSTAVVLLYLWTTINILNEYERGVVFRLGRLMP